jgi:hypothetical protein
MPQVELRKECSVKTFSLIGVNDKVKTVLRSMPLSLSLAVKTFSFSSARD